MLEPVQQDATIHSLLYFRKLLYMFRVITPPIISSTYNCNYSIWHWSKRSLLPSAVVETLGLVQQDATIYSLLYYRKLLYMFRVVTPPIIRSTYNCNYSIWHWSNRLCYLPLSWRRWDLSNKTRLYTVYYITVNCSTCFGW